MATGWLSYAWADNRTGDVDFVAQELEAKGLTVRRDKTTIRSGIKLWEQIERSITNKSACDAWIIFATQASLNSEPVKEELAYALKRALETRGGDFPIIAVFPDSADMALATATLTIRLCVSLTDPDWIERVISGAEGRSPAINIPRVDPYDLRIHPNGVGFAVEVRPRAGTWNPLIVAVPAGETDKHSFSFLFGAPGHVPMGGVMGGMMNQGLDDNKNWYFQSITSPASPSLSVYVFFKVLPSKLLFGSQMGPQYVVNFNTQPIS